MEKLEISKKLINLNMCMIRKFIRVNKLGTCYLVLVYCRVNKDLMCI